MFHELFQAIFNELSQEAVVDCCPIKLNTLLLQKPYWFGIPTKQEVQKDEFAQDLQGGRQREQSFKFYE